MRWKSVCVFYLLRSIWGICGVGSFEIEEIEWVFCVFLGFFLLVMGFFVFGSVWWWGEGFVGMFFLRWLGVVCFFYFGVGEFGFEGKGFFLILGLGMWLYVVLCCFYLFGVDLLGECLWVCWFFFGVECWGNSVLEGIVFWSLCF